MKNVFNALASNNPIGLQPGISSKEKSKPLTNNKPNDDAVIIKDKGKEYKEEEINSIIKDLGVETHSARQSAQNKLSDYINNLKLDDISKAYKHLLTQEKKNPDIEIRKRIELFLNRLPYSIKNAFNRFGNNYESFLLNSSREDFTEAGNDLSRLINKTGTEVLPIIDMIIKRKNFPFELALSIASSDSIDEKILLDLSKKDYGEESNTVLKKIVLNPQATQQVFESCLENEHEETHDLIATSEKVPVSLLEKILKTGKTGRLKYLAFNNPRTPKEVKLEFLKSDEVDGKLEIASSTNDVDTLKFLSKNINASVRQRIARRDDMLKDVLQNLGNDEDPEVRVNIALNKNTPEETLKKLIADTVTRVAACALSNPNTKLSYKEFKNYASNNDPFFRSGVAVNINTPADILTLLSNDLDTVVRQGVSENTNTPSDVLTLLAKDNEEVVRSTVARNEKTPPIALIKLASDMSFTVKINLIFSNAKTPIEALNILSNDSNAEIKAMANQRLEKLFTSTD